MSRKIRLVRCPKCQLVLPEPPEISVYRCGSCNTVLQAKQRNPDTKEAGFQYQETDENGPKEVDHKDTSVFYVEESSARGTTEINDSPVSPEQNCFEYADSSPEKKKEIEQDSISSQDIGQCGGNDGDFRWHQGRRVSHGFSTSMELTSNENEDSSLELKPYLVTEKGRYDTGKREYFQDSNFSTDIPIESSPESGHLSCQDRAGSKIQSVKREAEELFKDWTYKGLQLQAEESDSTDDNQSPWDDKVSPDARYVGLPSSADPLSNLPIAESRFGPTWTSRQPPGRKLKHPASSVTPEMPPKQSESQGYSRSGVYDPVSHKYEVQPHLRKSTFLEANRNTMKYTNYNQENFPGTSRDGHYSARRMRLQNEDYVPRLSMDVQSGQKNNAGFCSPDTPLYSEPDKLELLKKINELKDELIRTRISDLRFLARLSGEQKHTPAIYHEASPVVEGICSDFLRCSCHTKCSQVKYMSQGLRVSRMSCLGEAAYNSHRGTSACFPHGCRYSGSLPLHNMCCNDETQTFNKSCCCSSSSHQLHSGQQFLHDHKTKSNDRILNQETKGVRRVRDRDSSSKQYMRPTAGGSPLISCHNCSELLQLPADFLLLGRKSHRLKCNACRKVMTFSIQGGKHLVPCIADPVAPPPRETASSSTSYHNNKYANGEPPYVRCKNSMDTRKGKHKELLSPTSSAATLHKLMGYSSPSQVVRR